MPKFEKFDPKRFGIWLNGILKPYNYQVAPKMLSGKPGSGSKIQREYRLQLINKHHDTSKRVAKFLADLTRRSQGAAQVKFNKVSANSSKFPSFTFVTSGKLVDLVIAMGMNAGEKFEAQTIADLAKFFKTGKQSTQYQDLLKQMNKENRDFANVEIVSAKKRVGTTKKEGVPIEKLGEVIGDIVLKDASKKEWYISLKNATGNTFSSYSGAGSLFTKAGDLVYNSKGGEFLSAFGVDLNEVQAGFDVRNDIAIVRNRHEVPKANPRKIKEIFERAWGMNYFYVRKKTAGWVVFWLDGKKLDELSSNIQVTNITYPSEKTKQITILCSNARHEYKIEVRNSATGEYPNDIKIKTKK
jgi:hypothetical protein